MRHVLIAVVSIIASGISLLFWMVNPVTAIFTAIGGLAVRVLGRQPPTSDLRPWAILCVVWPLLVYPVYLLNERLSGGRGWHFAGMLFGAFFLAGFVIQLWGSSR